MIDRVAAKLGRKLYEVPVGFKWFVDGLLDGSLGFGGEESAGASFVRLDGSVWTTDKDGIIPALLAAEITARMGRDPGEIYRDLTREFGEPVYDRVEAPATPEQKEAAGEALAAAGPAHRPGGRKDPDHPHPRAGQRRAHRRIEGDRGKRLVRGASVRDRRISTRSTPRAFGERIICAASWRKPRPSSATALTAGTRQTRSPAKTRVKERSMSKQTRRQQPDVLPFCPRKSRDSIPWPSLPWTCAGPGIITPTRCGGSSIPCCGNSRITPGLFCRRSRGTRLQRVLADPAFRKKVDAPGADQASGGGDARVVSADLSAELP